MSKLTDVRLFNHATFNAKSTPRREKVLMALQEPDKLKLSEDDERYKDILVQAFTIMSKPNRSLAKCVRMLSQVCGISERNCYGYINDATYVFGNVIDINRQFLKTQRREALYKIIKKLEDAPKPDYKLILEANKLLIALDDLPKALPQAESEELQDLTIPVITFTSNFEDIEVLGDGGEEE